MKIVFGLLLAAGLAVPASSQNDDFERERDRFLKAESQIGTRFKQEPEAASETDARQMQKRLARCIYYGSRKEIDVLLANSDFDRIDFDATEFESETFFDDVNFGRCLGRAMKHSQYKIYASMQYSTLRNLLAEEAYLHANKDAPIREEGAPTLIATRFAVLNDNPRAGALAEVSDCISYRNASAAHEFLDSVPGTSGEDEALDNLYPTIVTCLDTETPPNLSRSLVRQMIADGMWSRSHHGGFAPANTKTAEQN